VVVSRKSFLNLILVLFLAFLAWFPLFSFLDHPVIRIWDESRVAINAIEMAESANLMVTTYDNVPEDWNTKPPLLIWLQALFISMVGVNELAIRLPGALAALATCTLLFLVLYRSLNNIIPAFAAVIILISSPGYVSFHGTRSGDYDSLLTLFTTLYCLSIYLYSQSCRSRHIIWFFIFLTLAVMTKGIAGMLILPGIFIFLLTDKKIGEFVRSRQTLIGAGFFIMTVGFYYLMREHFQPGYLKAVWWNEISGRYTDNVEGHAEPWNYYLKNLVEERYPWFIYILIPGAVLNLFHTNVKVRKFSLFCLVVTLTFFVIISFSVSKMAHYDLPAYPLMAIVCALFIHGIYNILQSSFATRIYYHYNFIPLLFLAAVLSPPYMETLNRWMSPTENEHDGWFYSLSYGLQDMAESHDLTGPVKIHYEEYAAHIEFYRRQLSLKGIKSEFTDGGSITEGDFILTTNPVFFQEKYSNLGFVEYHSKKHSKLIKAVKIQQYDSLKLNHTFKHTINYCYRECNPWHMEILIKGGNDTSAVSVFSDFETGYNCNDFRQHVVTTQAYSGSRSVYVDQDHQFSASFKCSARMLGEFQQMNLKGKIYAEQIPENLLVILTARNSNTTWADISAEIPVKKFKINEWNNFSIDLLARGSYPDSAEVITYFYSANEGKIYFDDLRVTFFR
jgi:4-amino-4-deoxy-L-arabinose transferase-like glycosyltransferase